MKVKKSSPKDLEKYNSISLEDLSNAAKLKADGLTIKTTHPAYPLMQAIKLIGGHSKYSDYFKQVSRSEIFSTILMYGQPAFYVTISPLDHCHFLNFVIANRTYDFNLGALPPELEDRDFRLKQAAENPVSNAIFFTTLINIILTKLFGFGNPDNAGQTNSYYGIFESQMRGTLHIHLMLWIKGCPSPDILYEKLNSDENFKSELFEYLESIIYNDVEKFSNEANNVTDNSILYQPILHPLNFVHQTDKMADYFRSAIKIFQTHFHTFSCFKNPKTRGKCRMRMPCEMCKGTFFDPVSGEICLKRLDKWINSYNKHLTAIANANTDIKFLFRTQGALNVIYYITMYITKSDDQIDNYYVLMKAAKQSLIDQPMNSKVTDLSEPQMKARSLLLRTYRKIQSGVQISANIVATLLLDLPMAYKSDLYVSINFFSLM